MHITMKIARAAGLIILAALMFLGMHEALDANVIGASQQTGCIGKPLTGCLLTII